MAEAAGAEGQWIHARLFGSSVPSASRVTLGEGQTPLQDWGELGRRLGVPGLWAKREDLSPTGSHKGRSLSLLCSDLVARGVGQAVISSSGNAAVAAACYATAAKLRLLSLVSERTPAVKLRALLAQPQLSLLTDQPVALLHHAVSAWGMSDLRASTNPLGPVAYRGIAAELLQAGPLAKVFVFSSSGATALGLCQGFELLRPAGGGPQVHLVQAAPGGELTRSWYPGPEGDPDPAPAAELGARRTRLAPQLRRMVRASGGRGWRVSGTAVRAVLELAQELGLETSWEGLAVLAAMREDHQHQGVEGGPGRRVAILTGAAWQLAQEPAPAPRQLADWVGTTRELDQQLAAAGFSRGAS